MSLFDRIAKTVVSSVTSVMGDLAVWVPSNGGIDQNGKVLYNCPDKEATIGDSKQFEYAPSKYSIEYFEGQFPGLKEAVDSGNVESIRVRGLWFDVIQVNKIWDGQTYAAYLRPSEAPALGGLDFWALDIDFILQ
jgi:hypothetical protein